MAASYAGDRIVPIEQWANLITGQYVVPGAFLTATETLALTANRLYLFPVFIPISMKVRELALVLTTGVNTSETRVGLFKWNHVDRSVKGLVRDFGKTLTEIANQGLVAYNPAADADDMDVPPGWYAFGLVSDATCTIRLVKGTDPMIGSGSINANTTNLEAVRYHYADGTGMVDGGLPTAAIAAGSVTAVESNSDFTQAWGVLCRFKLNHMIQ